MKFSLSSNQSYIDQCNDDDPDTVINTGCVLYKEGKYDEALKYFTKAQQLGGYNSSKLLLFFLYLIMCLLFMQKCGITQLFVIMN